MYRKSIYPVFENDVFPALVNDRTAVVERYGNQTKTFIYDHKDEDWAAIKNYHEERCNDVIYLVINVREILDTGKFMFPGDKEMVNALLGNGVDPNRIRFIVNYHSININQDDFMEHFGTMLPMLKLRYFEFDAVLRHRLHECLPTNDRYGWRSIETSQSLDTFTKYEKKFLGLFGKPYKYFRIGTVIHLYDRGLIDDYLLSLLVTGKGIDRIAKSVSNFFDEYETKRILHGLCGSPDEVEIDSPETLQSNYLGYPYDTTLYEKTFMSVISETHGSVMQNHWVNHGEFFITEKTSRTIENYHPFVILSTDRFLEKMRDEMGYQTFNEIVDESYDSEQIGYMKIRKAIDTSIELVKNINNPKLKEIVEYNKNHQRKVCEMESKNIHDFIFSNEFDYKL